MSTRRPLLIALMLVLALAGAAVVMSTTLPDRDESTGGGADAGDDTTSGTTIQAPAIGDAGSEDLVRQRNRVTRPRDEAGPPGQPTGGAPLPGDHAGLGETLAAELARFEVEKHRDDAHRRLTTVTWRPTSDIDSYDPNSGAEVVLVSGYLDYELVLLLRTDEGVLGARIRQPRRARGTPGATRVTYLSVSAGRFDEAWRAASLIRTAAAQRREPVDRGPLGGRRIVGSHAPHHVVAMRTHGGESEWLHRGAARGRTFRSGVRAWSEIQNEAIFSLLTDCIRSSEMDDGPLSLRVRDWVAGLIDDATKSVAADTPSFGHVALTAMLRALGDIGTEDHVATIEALRAAMEAHPNVNRWTTIVDEARVALFKIRARVSLDQIAAREVIGSADDGVWQRDLARWTAALLLAREPEKYRGALQELTRDPRVSVAQSALLSLLKHFPESFGDTLPGMLDHASPVVALMAAKAMLSRQPGDQRAVAALMRLAEDANYRPAPTQSFDQCPRAHSVRELVQHGIWEDEALRHAFRRAGEDARMVTLSILQIEKRGGRVEEQTCVAAYRLALDSPRDQGTLEAVERLIGFGDTGSYARLRGILDELERDVPSGEPDPLLRRDRERISWLRGRLNE